MTDPCPLCGSRNTHLFFTGSKSSGFRDFIQCSVCDLVFVPKIFFLNAKQEKERYLLHHNDPEDEGYRSFLNNLLCELRPHIKKDAKGLDYGSGPCPALVMMMVEDGFDIAMYDPYFHPDKCVLDAAYDFITCTETIEHFHNPKKEFDRFKLLLNRPGLLGIMTGMLEKWSAFPSWYYHQDPTHVSFYSRKTMLWISGHYSWDCCFPRKDVILFNKS